MTVERLGNPLPLDRLLHKGVHIGIFIGNQLPGLGLARLDQQDKACDNRLPRHGNSRQQHVDLEHKDNNKNDVDDFNDKVQNTVAQCV